jgi:hypothetical protein
MNKKLQIKFTDESIGVYLPDGKEVVFWHKDEWIEDPSIVFCIANAIKMAGENSEQLLKINKKHIDSQKV